MSRATGDFRSGGKIVRQRRRLLSSSRTPYDRPQIPPSIPVHNSNWLTTAGRVLVTGAGKLISTVIGSDTSSSDWSSDDEVDEDLEAESQQVTFASESKQRIEELIRQETFSREECDTMIQIIRSRTVDSFISSDNQDGDTNDIRDAAVIEARKWIEERKNETASKSQPEYGSGSLSSHWAPHIPKDAGSPIDVARTYMRVRPPWASPTANLSEIRSPTPVKIQTLTDGLSFPSVGGGDVSSSQTKKRHLLASGTWSIADEMRKVRARATDELLSTPSRKFDSSGFPLSRETNSDAVKHGPKETLGGSTSFTLALAAVADKGTIPATQAPTSTRSTALDTVGDGSLQGTSSFVPDEEMVQMAVPSTLEATEGVLEIQKDMNSLEGAVSTIGHDIQGVPSMAEGVTETCAPSQEGNHAKARTENVHNHTSHGTNADVSKHGPELDAYTGSSKHTSDEEPTSKSSPEVLLAPQETKKQHRVKQPVRVGRGKGRGRGK